MALPFLDRLQNQLLLLRAHAFQRSNASRLGRLGEIGEALDPQFLIEHRDGLRPDALEPQDFEQRLRKFGQQLLADGAVAGERDFANAAGEVLADPVPRAQAGLVQARHLLGGVADDVGGVAIGADLERVVALQLEQVRDLRQRARHGAVVERRGQGGAHSA